MGYRDFGTVYVVSVCGRYLIHCTRGCREYAFALRQPSVSLADRSA
jgi:hypothetical protein